MRGLLFAWVLLLAGIGCISQSEAFWQSRDSNYNISIGGVAGYQGPGDITSGAIAFYSAGRAYNAAYAAGQNPLADLVDTSTGALTCTLKVGTNGFADLTTAYCPTSVPTTNVVTWCTVTVGGCSVTKLYDQTGTGNHVVQATLANMPGLTFNAQNGLPCAAGGSNSPRLVTAGSISQSAPFTLTTVAEIGSAAATAQSFININAVQLLRHSAATTSQIQSGAIVTLTTTDNAFHALLAVVSGTAPLFAADSSANTSTSTSGTTAISAPLSILARSTGAGPLLASGFVCEAGLWPADLNSSYQAMLANMRSATNGWNF